MPKRSLPAFGSMFVLIVGCSEGPPAPAAMSAADPPQPPTAAAQSARPASTAKLDPKERRRPSRPESQLAKKTYYTEKCEIGALALTHAARAYEKSLGADKPGPGKLPSFGVPAPKEKEAKEPKERKEPKAARPSTGGAGMLQRLARVCNVAGSMGEPKHAELDPLLKEAIDITPPLGLAFANAGSYYANKEHDKDDFKKGRELHETLTKGFPKNAALAKKLRPAVSAFKKANPPAWESEPQKLSQAIVDGALALFFLLNEDKRSAADIDKAITALTEAIMALEKAKPKLEGDVYIAQVPEPARKVVERAKAAKDDAPPAATIELAWAVVGLLDARYNAYRRELSGAVDLPPEMGAHGDGFHGPGGPPGMHGQ